ncbi:MAG: 3-oxoacyl-[acyl-carrier-protein] reductase [Oligoflexia bacterium]|nr:3-oxoacyl-[acyl-carrier-protein] reductase [Oligoflexia bacterium]
MAFNYKDKVVVVTGGSRGIGRGIALAYAHVGAKVAITYQSNDEAAQKTLSELQGEGHKLYKFNVSDPQAVDTYFGQIQEDLGGLHVLINNAGIAKDQLLLRLKPEDWNAVIETNLRSVYACTKAAVKIMLRAKEGSVVNITSVIGQTGNAGQSNYAASKAGIIGFTKSIAAEVASRQIRLNCIAPGFIGSDMTESLTDAQKKSILERVPLGSMGEAADIAHACLFLTSPYARYITGHTLDVNGGLNMI